jgi:hypothetical protein
LTPEVVLKFNKRHSPPELENATLFYVALHMHITFSLAEAAEVWSKAELHIEVVGDP